MNPNYLALTAIANQVITERRQEADNERMWRLARRFHFGGRNAQNRTAEEVTAQTALIKPTSLSAA